MRLPHHHRRHAPAHDVLGATTSPTRRVALVGTPVALRDRLGALAARSPGVTLTAHVETPDELARLPVDVDVALVAVADDDPAGALGVRQVRRALPGAHLVVAGAGTEWFEDAFDLGADAWIDHAADDATLLAAIGGVRPLARRRR